MDRHVMTYESCRETIMVTWNKISREWCAVPKSHSLADLYLMTTSAGALRRTQVQEDFLPEREILCYCGV
jgi:hypothetical protein